MKTDETMSGQTLVRISKKVDALEKNKKTNIFEKSQNGCNFVNS